MSNKYFVLTDHAKLEAARDRVVEAAVKWQAEMNGPRGHELCCDLWHEVEALNALTKEGGDGVA